jgi:hypothetical protein
MRATDGVAPDNSASSEVFKCANDMRAMYPFGFIKTTARALIKDET